jgi:hypothetical protein
MNTSNIPFRLSVCAVAVLISACGGGSATAPATVPGSSGLAVDDYIKGATVLCDANGNSISDAGEATTKTDSIGFFKFTPVCASSIVVTGGTNIDTGLPFVGKLKAPAGATVVTPLTTLLSEGMTNDQISAAMGLPVGTDVSSLDPARKEDGKLVRPEVLKRALALQQLMQKTAESMAALVPGSDVNNLYGEVAAAMAAAMRTSPTLVVSGLLDLGAVTSLVQAAATRLQPTLGSSVNPATLGALMSPALKVQGDQILGASDANLTTTTKAVQGDAKILNFVSTNKSALSGAPSTVTALADQLKTQVMPAAPPPPTDPNVLLNFDDVTADGTGFNGGEGSAISNSPPAGGGTGNAYEVKRLGGDNFAGASFLKVVPLTAERRTISARVYSPLANIPMPIKLENAQSSAINSGDVLSNETVVQGWQTLTWTISSENISKSLNKIVLLPRLGTVDTAPVKSYFYDNITLIATTAAPAPAPAPVPTTEPSCATTALQCVNFRESTIGVQGFGNLVASEIADDPATGAANKVLKLVKAAPVANVREPWAGATVRTMRTGTEPNFVDTIDRVGLSTSKIVNLRSYSSAPVGTKITLKLENGVDPTKFVIAQASTTVVNGWEMLAFDFATLTNGTFDAAVTFNKASILPGWTEVGGTSSLTAEATFYFDELKYSLYTAPAPTPAPPPPPAPTTDPTTAPTTVIPSDAAVIYSDAASVAGLDAAPNWSQNPPVVASEPTIANNKSRQYVFSAGALYQGIDWAASPQNVTTKGKLHLDFFSSNITSVKVSIISVGGAEQAFTQAVTAGSWNSVDIDLSNYTTPDKSKIYQIKLEPNVAGSLFVDNIYFWGTAGGVVATGPLVYASNYSESPAPWRSLQGGDAGRYAADGATDWWSGLAAGDATPSYYFGYGLTNSAATWGFGAFVKAPSNGIAQVSGYANVRISVWGNDQLVNQSPRPNFTLVMHAPAVGTCIPKVKKDFAVTGAGVQTYTIALNQLALQDACGFANAAAALATGVAEVHVQVLGSNLNFTVKGAPADTQYPNGLNMGPISFTN